MNKEQEIWRTYPKYPFIEANQFGEVRTKDRYVMRKNGIKYHVKGHILKQYVNERGYLFVHFNANGKQVNLKVHRIIATCFIPNPDNLPQVNHKDNNPKNNTVSNLEWCTSQYNSDYKKNFGTSPAELFGTPVFAVNLKTGKVFYFESQCEASRQLGVSQGHIGDVINSRLNQAGGYWFTEDESEITEKKIKEVRDNMQSCPVIAVNPKTSEVFWFESQHEAARQLSVSQAHICAVVKGQRKTTGGYWFCRADEDAVGETRKKFGDEMANKVKKLMKKKTERVIV